MWPCNSMSMRVQAPPLRCRGDSLSPNPATGSQRVAAGINGEIWEPHPDRSLSKNLWAAQAKTWLSHRDCKPAQEADALEPKGTGYGAGSLRYGPVCTADTPGGEHRPTDANHGNWERSNLVRPLRETTGAGANRMAYGEGFLKKPRPGVMPRIR
jgi:hypothetical protein